MSILDHFRNISGAEIYKETCEIIKQYHLYYQVEAVVPTDDPEEQAKRHKMKRKSFYLDSFANKDWFIQFKYAPVKGKFIPYLTRICKVSNILITEEGIKCNPDNVACFAYNMDYCLADWKEVKKKLIRALEYALDTANRVQEHWGDWLAGEEDKTLIHYEQAKKPNTVIIKKAKKTEADNA
jgi:hypothetical protein